MIGEGRWYPVPPNWIGDRADEVAIDMTNFRVPCDPTFASCPELTKALSSVTDSTRLDLIEKEFAQHEKQYWHVEGNFPEAPTFRESIDILVNEIAHDAPQDRE
jgi:hypothetical protein